MSVRLKVRLTWVSELRELALSAAFQDAFMRELKLLGASWAARPSLTALPCALISEASWRLQPRRWRR